MEEHDIKESGEVLKAVMKLGALLAREFKDGFQPEDLATIVGGLLADPVFLAAAKDAGKIKDEMKNLSLDEGFRLAIMALEGVKEIIDVVKSE